MEQYTDDEERDGRGYVRFGCFSQSPSLRLHPLVPFVADIHELVAEGSLFVISDRTGCVWTEDSSHNAERDVASLQGWKTSISVASLAV